MPDSTSFRRFVAACLVLVASALLSVAAPAFVSAATPVNSGGVSTAPPNSGLLWGLPVGMTLWGLAGLVAVVVGLIVAAKPARRFKALAHEDVHGLASSELLPQASTAATAG